MTAEINQQSIPAICCVIPYKFSEEWSTLHNTDHSDALINATNITIHANFE